MIPVNKIWQDIISQIYKGPSKCDFYWYLYDDNFRKAKEWPLDGSSGKRIYSLPGASIDFNIDGDYVASTEQGRWILDGSRHSAWQNNETTEARFEQPISHSYVSDNSYVAYEFKEKQKPISELTIIWDSASRTYPATIYVTINNSTPTYKVFNNANYITHISLDGLDTEFSEISISAFDWNREGVFTRIDEVFVGPVLTNQDIDILSIEETKEISILSNAAPKWTATVKISNIYKTFDPLQKTGVSSLISKNSRVYYRWSVESTDKKVGTMPGELWYVLSYDIPTDSSEVSLILGTQWDFTDFTYYNELDLNDNPSMYDWIKSMFRDSNESIEIPSSLNQYKNLGVPDIVTCKENLQYIAVATKHLLLTQYDNALVKLVEYNDQAEPVAHIGKNLITGFPSITKDTAIKYIEINFYTNKLVKNSSTIRTWDIDTSVQQWQSSGMSSYATITTTYTSGGSEGTPIYEVSDLSHSSLYNPFVYQGPRTPVVIRISDVDGAARYTATVSAYVGNRSVSTITYDTGLNIDDLTTEESRLQVDNKFITGTNNLLNTCADFISKIVNNRLIIEFDYLGMPELEPGDIITCDTDYGNFKVVITKTTLSFNGGFKGKISGRIIGEV